MGASSIIKYCLAVEIGQFGGDILIPPVHARFTRCAELGETVEIFLYQRFTFCQDEIALIVRDRAFEHVETVQVHRTGISRMFPESEPNLLLE